MWEKVNFQKFYIFVYNFLDIQIIFWPFIGKVSTRLSKLPSVCPSEHFEGTKKVLKKKWKRKKLSILEHWSKNFRLSNENISAGFQNCIPRLHLKLYEEERFYGKCYLFDNPFRKLEEKFSEFRQIILGKAATTAL